MRWKDDHDKVPRLKAQTRMYFIYLFFETSKVVCSLFNDAFSIGQAV
jgi:hypothetical protein